MFSGIVEELGHVRELADHRLEVGCRTVPVDSPIGASVAVNGVCLTVVDHASDRLAFDVSAETQARTALGELRPGARVNLERPVTLATRLSGHLVQGHVDGVATVVSVERDDLAGAMLRLEIPAALMRYVVEKGSIAVDGVSLTVAALHDDGASVALIPHTLAVTTLGTAAPADPVHLEVDVIAKYVERLTHADRRQADRSQAQQGGSDE
jgi:riboflavin synthase